MPKTITGPDAAIVNVGDGRQVVVRRGQELPSGVSSDEVKRLDKLGAFRTRPAATPAAPPAAPAPPPGPLTAAQLDGMNVDDVLAYVEANPDQADHVRALEADGQKRKGILGE
jgi:hypothetical protein